MPNTLTAASTKARTAVEQNVPATLAAVLGAAVTFATDLIDWAVGYIPDDVPPEVVTSGRYLVLVAIAWKVGRWAQRFTEPRAAVDEILHAVWERDGHDDEGGSRSAG